MTFADGFQVHAGWETVLEAAGIRSVGDVLDRAECIRDLPDRANLVLEVARQRIHVKHLRRVRGRSPKPHPEARAIRWAREHGLPVPALVFSGVDPARGLVAGTHDLGPARPLDDVLREDGLPSRGRRRLCLDLASAVARLHEARGHHRDLYLNHIYVDPARERPLVAIIDWERAGRHRRRLGRWVVKDLAALLSSMPDGGVSATERTRFYLRYLRLRGLVVGRTVRRLSRRVERRAARMHAHVPRTPVGAAARPKAGGA